MNENGINDGLGMRFMGEYIRGVVVKLHVTPEQEVMFKQNFLFGG